MTKGEGNCNINAVEVGELVFKQIGSPTPVLSVKYALANAESGSRFGAGDRNVNWSKKTLDALTSLLQCVEEDIAGDLFGETTTRSVVELPEDTADGVPSL